MPQFIKTDFLNPRKDALSVVAFSEDKEEGAAPDAKPKMGKDVIKVMVKLFWFWIVIKIFLLKSLESQNIVKNLRKNLTKLPSKSKKFKEYQ